ncbi:MAG: hypothetical protein IKM26_00165 [Clostridia bacterium]|nr:hypothetical protein [Clostridia bacterium]MBR6786318.1 hypothetical protein [Clostridia bacterium]
MFTRTYVQVIATFNEDGSITPHALTFHDQQFIIDRVLDRRPAAATKAGGQGMRYTVRIGGKQTYIFLDEQQRWFVEEKEHVRQISNP